jgi:hypothetical protein
MMQDMVNALLAVGNLTGKSTVQPFYDFAKKYTALGERVEEGGVSTFE